MNIDTTVNRDISQTAYNFKRINFTFLTNLINDTNLCDNVNNFCNIDDAWAKWNSLVMDIINKCVPKIIIKDNLYLLGWMEKFDISETKHILHGQLLKDMIDIHLGENSNISEQIM